jgi:hypothetical protein
VHRRFALNVRKLTIFAAFGLVYNRSPFTARIPSAFRLWLMKFRMNDSKLLPLAVTLKDAVLPSKTVASTGWLVIGGFKARISALAR